MEVADPFCPAQAWSAVHLPAGTVLLPCDRQIPQPSHPLAAAEASLCPVRLPWGSCLGRVGTHFLVSEQKLPSAIPAWCQETFILGFQEWGISVPKAGGGPSKG